MIGFQAALFDMDGTIIDSEGPTDLAIAEAMAGFGVEGARLSSTEIRGRTWEDVASTLNARYGTAVPVATLADAMLQRWLLHFDEIRAIAGADAALREAAGHLGLAVVSSSPRFVIDRFLAAIGVDDLIGPDRRVGAEDVTRPKPAPEGFLRAAAVIGAPAAACVVFEDGVAGVHAARAAGMASVGVTCTLEDPDELRSLTDAHIHDYRDLPPGFWAALRVQGRGALPG